MLSRCAPLPAFTWFCWMQNVLHLEIFEFICIVKAILLLYIVEFGSTEDKRYCENEKGCISGLDFETSKSVALAFWLRS